VLHAQTGNAHFLNIPAAQVIRPLERESEDKAMLLQDLFRKWNMLVMND
jgi:hypothetical protein